MKNSYRILRNITAVILVLSLAFGVYASVVIGEISTESPFEVSTEAPSVKFYEAFTLPDDSSASVMNTGTDDAESYDVYALLEFDYPDLDLSTLDGLDVEARRDAVRDYYKPRNEQIVSQLGLEGVTVSYSAPYADMAFDSIAEYQTERDGLIAASENASVELIGVSLLDLESGETTEDGGTTESEGTTEESADCTVTELKSAVGIPTDNTYSGNNIKVGLIESGLPDEVHVVFGGASAADSFDFYPETADAQVKIHATKVAAIIDSIAPNVTYYSAAPGADASQITQALNWLLTEKKVDIINLSAAFVLMEGDEDITQATKNNNAGPIYTQLAAYVDYLIATNGCLIVKASGNRAKEEHRYDREITAPGMGINVLTVGSVSKTGAFSFYSSFVEKERNILKPEVVAPGEQIVITGLTDEEGALYNKSGTSYSAPVVTGIAALLMEEFPKLKTNVALLKGVIMAGCEHPTLLEADSYEFLDSRSGFGIVNYSNSRTVMSGYQYGSEDIVLENEIAGANVYGGTFTIMPGEELNLKLSRRVYGDSAVFSNNKMTPVMPVYRVVVEALTSSGTVEIDDFIWDESISYVNYQNVNYSSMYTRINIYTVTDVEATVEKITVTYTGAIHTHRYSTHYTAVNNLYHYGYCSCDERELQSHSYPEEESEQRYCIDCGYPEGYWDY